MIIINFARPLTNENLHQLEMMLDEIVERVITVPVQLNLQVDLIGQVRALTDQIDLTSQQWYEEYIIVNPPEHNVITAIVLVELYGHMAYFPSMIHMLPVKNAMSPKFEVAGVIDLAAVFDQTPGSNAE